MKYFLFDKAQKYVTRINAEYLIEAHYTEEINTAGQLEFTLPATMRLPKNVFYVCVTDPDDERSYLMFKIVTEKVTDEKVTYTCIENAYDELSSYNYIKDKRPTAIADYMLKQALEGTRWSVGQCPTTSQKFCSFYYISVLEAIQKIVNLWGLEVQFQVKIDGITNEIKQRNVNLYTKLGKRTNKRFEYGSNLLSVTQANDSTGLYTALVGRGKGVQVSSGDTDTDPDGYGRRITFADVVWSTQNGNPLNKPAGQEYLEDPNATAAYGFPDGHPRIGFVTFQDCEDPNELIQLTYDKLQEVNHPQVQFSASIADVGSLDLGDTIAIVRHDIGIEYYTRVFKVVHDLLDSSKNTVELGDNIAGSNSITQQISNIQNNQSNVQNAIDTIVMNGADGNKLFFGTDFPANGTDGDVFYKTLENGGTEMYIYKDGGWQLVVSTEELGAVQKQVDEQTSQIQQAVDSANSAVSKADEAVSKVESTKSDLQSTVQELQGVSNNLNVVKQQAISQGRTIIDIQKSTIDLSTKMADVQGNVSSLQQTTRSLQSSVQDNTNNISNVKQTATQLSSTIGNLQNAGENLIVNSDFEQGSYHWYMNIFRVSPDKLFRNHKVATATLSGFTSPQWKELSTTDLIPVTSGQTISIGVWIKTENVDGSEFGGSFGLNWYADTNSGRNHWNDYSYPQGTPLNHDWQFLKIEGVKVPSDSSYVKAHFFLEQNGTVYYALPIMVYGDTLPAWSPNPLDSATTTDMSSVKQTVSSLQSTVQSNTGDISTLKQTANSLQSSIQSKADLSQITQLSNAIQSTVQSIGTIFPNGEFDDLNGRNYWLPWDTTTDYSRVYFKQGGPNGINGYMQLNPINGGTVKVITSQYIPVTPNSNVNFSCQSFIWGVDDKPLMFRAYFHFYDANKSQISFESIDLVGDTRGKWYSKAVTIPIGKNVCYVRVEVMATAYESCIASTTDFKITSGDNDSVMSKISQLSNDVNLRVQKGDLISQINIEAGKTLIQSDKLYLDASSVVFSGNAFIPSAAITDLSADKITTGTLNAANVHIINLDVSNLVGNTTSFVQSKWNSINRQITINGDGINFYAENNEHITINNGNIQWYNSQGFKMMGFERAVADWQPLGGGLALSTYGDYALELGDATLDVAGVKLKFYNNYMLKFVKYKDGSVGFVDAHGNGFWWSNNGFGILHENSQARLDGVSLPIQINSDGTVQSWVTI